MIVTSGSPLDARIDETAASSLGIGLVRRPTGGSAILHEGPDLELTYSVVAAAGDFDGAADLLQTYQWIGRALAAGINRIGAPVEMVPVHPSDPAAMPKRHKAGVEMPNLSLKPAEIAALAAYLSAGERSTGASGGAGGAGEARGLGMAGPNSAGTR